MQKKQLEAAASFVSDRLKYEPTGHDAAHIDRVRQLARQIANQEGGSLFVICLFIHISEHTSPS
ncbi:hypothetical protein ACQ4LK_20625, partial [Bacillus pumilus]